MRCDERERTTIRHSFTSGFRWEAGSMIGVQVESDHDSDIGQ